jgi:hypothetical protein
MGVTFVVLPTFDWEFFKEKEVAEIENEEYIPRFQ